MRGMLTVEFLYNFVLIFHNGFGSISYPGYGGPTESELVLNDIVDSKTPTLDGIAQFPVPYLVSIQQTNISGTVHLCSGTIIDESFILTAAHCFVMINHLKEYSVVPSPLFMSTTTTSRHSIVAVYKHELFEPLAGRDIALVKIEPKFHFDGEKISKVVINASENIGHSVDGYLMGWERRRVMPRVELISFRTIRNTICKDNNFKYITQTEVCAISYKGRGACDGDSGGPLISGDFKSQLAILSYGKSPCKRGKIYAFTRISKLHAWIEHNLARFGKIH